MSEALRQLMNVLNVFGSDAQNKEAVVSIFATTHRTLQQQFVKVVIIPILTQLANDYIEGRFDLRNKASAALAAKMLRAVDDNDLFLPFH